MSEGGISRSRSKSSSYRTEDSYDSQQWNKHSDSMGFEPWMSWSQYYSFSERWQDECNEAEQDTATRSPSPSRFESVKFDEEGNYVIDKKDTTKYSTKAIISPRSISARNKSLKIRSPVKSPASKFHALTKNQDYDEMQLQRTIGLYEWKNERIDESINLECTICRDTVLRRQNKRDRLFGLLPECTHIFCLNCIVERGAAGRCPGCHTKYSQIIPCPYYITCPKQKQRMLEAMRKGDSERIKNEWWVDGAPVIPIATGYEQQQTGRVNFDGFEATDDTQQQPPGAVAREPNTDDYISYYGYPSNMSDRY